MAGTQDIGYNLSKSIDLLGIRFVTCTERNQSATR
jgi:hypothetical protein